MIKVKREKKIRIPIRYLPTNLTKKDKKQQITIVVDVICVQFNITKESLLRDLDDQSHDEIIAQLERDLYKEINALGVGPMGVGGETTCLAVKINYYPMHIASLPVAINIQCHSARHIEVII